MPHPQARRNRGRVGDGLKTVARQRWLQRRREEVTPLITFITKTVGANTPVGIRIITILSAKVEQDSRDVWSVLWDVLEDEYDAVPDLPQEAQQKTKDALFALVYSQEMQPPA